MLSMSYNNITDDACDVIAEALQVNNTLEKLYIYGNKISKEASQLIVNSLRRNNSLTNLWLPMYTEDDDKQLLSLQDIVNKERTCRGCQVMLNIVFVGF